MSNTVLSFNKTLTQTDPQNHPVLIIGQLRHLSILEYQHVQCKLVPRVTEEIFQSAITCLHPSPTDFCPLYLDLATIAALPIKCSRHNASSRGHAITRLVKTHTMNVTESILVGPSIFGFYLYIYTKNRFIISLDVIFHFDDVLLAFPISWVYPKWFLFLIYFFHFNFCIGQIVCEKKDLFASACAVARAFPLYSRKTGGDESNDEKITVNVEFILIENDAIVPGNSLSESDVACLTNAANGIRLAARIVDAPCNEMNVSHFVDEVRAIASELSERNVKSTIIRGEELNERGFGGIYGVGKAATVPPALAVLSYEPTGATETYAWVGKGIVYDTGGLSIKQKTSMPGMKRDCGGAAAILGAFQCMVKAGFNQNLHAVFCLAENAVGPNATR